MKKNSLIALAATLAFVAVNPCTARAQDLQKFEEEGKWGFLDSQGNMVVKPVYDTVFDFSEGLARVLKKDRFGFIDAEGNEVIKAKYISALDFKDGVAIVTEKNTKWLLGVLMAFGGAVQAAGQSYVYNGVSRSSLGYKDQVQYDINASVIQAELQKNSTAAGQMIKTVFDVGLIDKTGREIIPTKYVAIDNFKDNLWVVSTWSENTTSTGYPNKVIYGYEQMPDKQAIRELKMEPMFKYGIFNTDTGLETKITYTRFDPLSLIHKSLIVVGTSSFKMGSPNYWKHRQGVIDYTGKEIIPLQYDFLDAEAFAPNERILVGNILKRKFLNIFSGEVYVIERAEFGVIDHTGETIIPLTECKMIVLEGDGFVMASASGAKRYFDLDGREISE